MATLQAAQADRNAFACRLHQERGTTSIRELTPRLEEDGRRVHLWTKPLTEGG
jgi:hypothetical protein